jgi:hypothetical protein
MAEPKTPDSIPITINLPMELARRLKLATDTQKRTAPEVILELLERHLPRTDGPKKGSIPYV